MASVIEPAMDEPIARAMDGAPLLYACRGFAFHLEPLEPGDREGLSQACERIMAAHAGALRWVYSSVHGSVEKFSPDVLELVSSFPAQLADPAKTPGASAMNAAYYDRFGLACHGGRAPNHASPSTLRFFASVRASKEPRLRADAMLAATFPSAMPDEALESLAVAVAGDLRIRWGAAGLAYGAWELDRYGATRDAIFAHARRHPGYDVAQHSTWMREFADRLRTVSWLTFVGPDLASKVDPSAFVSDGDVVVEEAGSAKVLRAGASPQPGDVNRDDRPRAYAEVDRRLRRIRASEGLHFYAPWTSATTESWLRRFEATR